MLHSKVTPGRSEVSCPDRIPDGRCPDVIEVAKNVVRTVQTLSGQKSRPSGHVRTSAKEFGQHIVACYFRCVRPKTFGRTNVRTFPVRPDVIEVAEIFVLSVRHISDGRLVRPKHFGRVWESHWFIGAPSSASSWWSSSSVPHQGSRVPRVRLQHRFS